MRYILAFSLFCGCLPCYRSAPSAYYTDVIIVYANRQGCSRGPNQCKAIELFHVQPDSSIDTLCLWEDGQSSFYGTDCYVVFSTPSFYGGKLEYYVVQFSDVRDTIEAVWGYSPCHKGQIFSNKKARYNYRCLINGEWYEGPVIYR